VHLVFLSESLLFRDYYSLHIVIVDVSTSEFIDLFTSIYYFCTSFKNNIPCWLKFKNNYLHFFSFLLVNKKKEKCEKRWMKISYMQKIIHLFRTDFLQNGFLLYNCRYMIWIYHLYISDLIIKSCFFMNYFPLRQAKWSLFMQNSMKIICISFTIYTKF